MNDDLYFDGKKYISSSRAAKISGYVNDYIGQLCRDGKLDCRMVGRSWYVGLESLIQHKSSNLVGTRSRGPRDTKSLIAEAAKTESIPTPKIEQEGLLNFSIGSDIVSVVGPSLDLNIPTPVAPKVPLVSYPAFKDPQISYPVFADSIPVAEPVVAVSIPSPVSVSKPSVFSSVGVRLFVGTLALLVALSGFQFGISANKDSRDIYARLWNGVNSEMQANVLGSVAHSIGRVPLVVYNTLHDWFVNTKETVLVLAGKEDTQVNRPTQVTQPNTVSTGPRQGMVVVPIKENTDRPAVVAKIKSTFSDEVSVAPDNSESGVITPVFKESKGDDYLYVLVPIKN